MISSSVIFFIAFLFAFLFIVVFSYRHERDLHEGCNEDYDCSNGLLCDSVEHVCRNKIGGQCNSIAECGNDATHCYKGVCMNTIDGAEGESCPCGVDYACDPRSKTCKKILNCQDTSECVYGNVCISGVCSSQIAKLGPCNMDSQCMDGLICKQYSFLDDNGYTDEVSGVVNLKYTPPTLLVNGVGRTVNLGEVVLIMSDTTKNFILSNDGKLSDGGTMIRANLEFVIPFNNNFIGLNTNGSLYMFDDKGSDLDISTANVTVDVVNNLYTYKLDGVETKRTISTTKPSDSGTVKVMTSINPTTLITTEVEVEFGQILVEEKWYYYHPQSICT
jgi:hypothetical protein